MAATRHRLSPSGGFLPDGTPEFGLIDALTCSGLGSPESLPGTVSSTALIGAWQNISTPFAWITEANGAALIQVPNGIQATEAVVVQAVGDVSSAPNSGADTNLELQIAWSLNGADPASEFAGARLGYQGVPFLGLHGSAKFQGALVAGDVLSLFGRLVSGTVALQVVSLYRIQLAALRVG